MGANIAGPLAVAGMDGRTNLRIRKRTSQTTRAICIRNPRNPPKPCPNMPPPNIMPIRPAPSSPPIIPDMNEGRGAMPGVPTPGAGVLGLVRLRCIGAAE